VGADTVSPSDCGGYTTLCGVTVPEAAAEYSRIPEGVIVSRPLERMISGFLLSMVRTRDGAICKLCLRKIEAIDGEATLRED